MRNYRIAGIKVICDMSDGREKKDGKKKQDYCNSHSNAETMWMVFPSISISRVGENAMRVRRLHESASDALTSDDVSRSYARGLSIS